MIGLPPAPVSSPRLISKGLFEKANSPTCGMEGGWFMTWKSIVQIDMTPTKGVGWGDIAGKPNLALIWITDENGTHYFVIKKSSDAFGGYRLRAEDGRPTDSRLEDGFFHIIKQLEEKQGIIREIERQISDKQATRVGADVGAGLIIIAGAIICGVMTGGLCFAPFAVTALGGIGVAVGANSGAQSLEEQLIPIKEELTTIEGNLIVKY